MNTKPNITRILCYGDSNTWGNDGKGDRYDNNVRWTGVLQNLLGNEYEIIEEGLRGRTTVLDDPDSSYKNGQKYLPAVLATHNPFDVFLIMLGTNDAKEFFKRTSEEISEGVADLLDIFNTIAVDKNNNKPKVLVVSPVPVIEEYLKDTSNFRGAGDITEKLPKYLKMVAEKYNAEFLDLAEVTKVSEIDGVHLSAESHKKIAEALFKKIKSL